MGFLSQSLSIPLIAIRLLDLLIQSLDRITQISRIRIG